MLWFEALFYNDESVSPILPAHTCAVHKHLIVFFFTNSIWYYQTEMVMAHMIQVNLPINR